MQRRLSSKVALGFELFHLTARSDYVGDETRFNLGLIVDFTDFHHLLLSVGRGLQGSNQLQSYLAYEITFRLPQKAEH